jgi:hypothetical protein
MQTLEEILKAARRLPDPERRRLIEELENGGGAEAAEARRKAALDQFLAMAGTAHSDVTDLSENKNKYLAEIYATKP